MRQIHGIKLQQQMCLACKLDSVHLLKILESGTEDKNPDL